MALSEKGHDVEKGRSRDSSGIEIGVGDIINENAVPKEASKTGDSIFARARKIAGNLRVEQRGIERVPEDEKTDTTMSHAGTLWLSANMVVSSFAIGALSMPVFGLTFLESALVIVFINILGIMPVCFFATFGPKFGLRQMILSRFYFGYYGAKLIAVINILMCVGWSSINAIVGAQLFHAVNPDMPGWAGILLIAISTLLVCVFGYRIVHTYERFAWMPCFVIFLVVLGVFARSGDFVNSTTSSSLAGGGGGGADRAAKAAAVLSFASAVFGFATGWCALAADYTVYMRSDTPRAPIFLWTLAGLLLPLCFTQLLGAAIATAMAAGEGADGGYSAAYAEAGIGGLLARVLVPPLGRFGEFCLVVLALSTIANNCPNSYSVSLSLQAATSTAGGRATGEQESSSPPTSTSTPPQQGQGWRQWRVPRFVWVVVATAAYVAIAVAGYDHFEAALENFMLVIGYWLAIYEGVALAEHAAFRGCSAAGYRPGDYDDPARLPPGLAALAAFAFGILGTVLGMAQTWFVGPVGRLIGGGGDVGFELAFTFAFVSYLGFRALERSYFGR